MKLLSILSLFFSVSVFSQTLTPQVINSAGGDGTVGTGATAVQVYYNIGEPLINTISNGNSILTQGFLQPDILRNFGLTITPLFSN